jgi:hypothetical protein
MNRLIAALTFAVVSAVASQIAWAEPSCLPDERQFDLTNDIPKGTAAVWLIPVGPVRGKVTYYELGHPEGRVPFGGGGPDSLAPHRLDIHGRGIICVAGEGIQGFIVQRAEPGA